MPGDFKYGYYNLFKIDRMNREIEPLDYGPGQNKFPKVSPDGGKVAFISNRNGIDNIYVGYLDSAEYFPVTDILTGVRSISWSPESDKIAFSAFHKGAFDIFILKDLVPQGDSGKLALTPFMQGSYDLLQKKPVVLAQAETDQDSLGTDLLSSIDSVSGDYMTYEISPDSFQVVLDSAVSDTAEIAGDSSLVNVPEEEKEDSTSTTSGISDDEYVFVSEKEERPYDDYLIDLKGENDSGFFVGREEPPHFDSIPLPAPGQEYNVKKYKVKFTPDYIGGGVIYDTFFGVRGDTYFVFSDYLGNHQIIIATDLVNTIDQSNIQAFYFYNKKRVNLGVGLFHTKNYYEDNNDFLFSDRFYGFQFLARRPSSTFGRIQFTASQFFIDREYYDVLDTRENRSSKITTAELSYVTDNIIWGITGPVNGRRAKLTLLAGVNLFDSDDIEFEAVEFDWRKYWHFNKTFTMALRFSGGVSFGETPKLYFLGGTTNWIGTRTLDAKVYEVENLYFADVVTPLRGVPYYDLSGDRYGLINWEFRFPMIEYFAMRFPLPLVLSRVTGAIFTDIGAAWYGDDFKGGTSEGGDSRFQDIYTGFGFGMRANLGIFVLRYDLAWSTDFSHVSDKPSYYFSFGADF